jgi:hypothetical protein
MTAIPFPETRTKSGRFAPGHSGNPAGRPKGARNRATLAAEAILAENAEGLAERLVADGLAGDGQALRFLVGRCLPAATGRPIALDVAPGREGDFLHVHGLVVRAMADGEITPQEALAASRVLALGLKLAERRDKLARKAAAAASGERARPHAAEGAGTARGNGKGEAAASVSPSPSESGAPAPARAREGEPVSRLYSFAAPRAETQPAPVPDLYVAQRPRGDLYASTALARLGAGASSRLFPPVNSSLAGSTRRAAA